MKTPLRVLIVEDSESDAVFVIRQLKKAEYLIQHERVETAKDMKAALEKQEWDIVISDYQLPRFSVLAALALLQKTKLDIPFIVVSGYIGEEDAVELMKAGVHDYLMKDKLARLVQVVKRELAEAQMRREHKKIEEESLLLAQAVKSTRDCISITDLENKILFVNDSFLSTYGYSETELLGKNISIIRSPMVSSEESKAVQSGTMRDGWHGEIRNRRKNGTEFIVELWTSVVISNSGNPIAMIGVARDITERKRAEELMEKSEEKFRQMFDDAPLGYHEIDAKGNIKDINRMELEMLGYTLEEMLGAPVWKFNSDKEAAKKRVLSKLEGTMPCDKQVERIYTRKDGTTIPILIDDGLLKDKEGNITGIRTIIQDITERRRAEEALRKSEENYRSIFDNAAEGIFQSTPEGKFLMANPAMARILGFSSAEELIRERTDIARQSYVHPERREEFKRLMEQQNKVLGFEFEVPCKNGNVAWVSETAQAVRDATGRVVRYEGFFIDITERKKAEIELRESEERYRRLVEFSPDAIAVHSEGKIVYVNSAAIILLGANNASELIGKPFLDIIHPDYRDSIHQQIIAVMKEEYALPLTEQKFIRLDGSTVEVEVAALPIVYKEKSAMQMVAHDISEQKKLQSELLQTQKIQSIGTLAGGIAHDFNNILGIILAYSSLLNKNTLTPDKLSMSITAINQAVQRGAALVRQILTFARKTDIVFEPMDISELIHELLSMLEQTFPKTITLSESIADSLPLIFADRTQVHQALLNLCINARDAMQNGGSIFIAAEKHTKEQMVQQFPTANEEAYVCLTVTDTGKGMDEATCLRVFDPFFTTKEKGKGTGLGLSVVYGVVQAHHGFIDLKSEPGRGTTFRLFFPVPTINEQIAESHQRSEPFEIGGTETILFVEDEDLLIQMVSFLLESKGYSVLCARDGLEAINVYQSNKQKIALVITDMGLPVMTGTDEFKKLKEINPTVKVIFASGYFEPDVKSELWKNGATGFIQKPYEPNDVLRIIRQVLDQKA
ncbi:MAG: PAS domain S-box protein [Bacteroidota bacterium]|jgi:PAS domain S-box-containing protein